MRQSHPMSWELLGIMCNRRATCGEKFDAQEALRYELCTSEAVAAAGADVSSQSLEMEGAATFLHAPHGESIDMCICRNTDHLSRVVKIGCSSVVRRCFSCVLNDRQSSSRGQQVQFGFGSRPEIRISGLQDSATLIIWIFVSTVCLLDSFVGL